MTCPHQLHGTRCEVHWIANFSQSFLFGYGLKVWDTIILITIVFVIFLICSRNIPILMHIPGIVSLSIEFSTSTWFKWRKIEANYFEKFWQAAGTLR